MDYQVHREGAFLLSTARLSMVIPVKNGIQPQPVIPLKNGIQP